MTSAPAPERDQRDTPRRWPWRRALSLLFGASTIGVLVGSFLELGGWSENLFHVVRMLSPLTAILLMFAVGFASSRPDEELDERLRAARDRAHRYGYSLVSVVVLTLLLAAFARASLTGWSADVDALLWWLLGVTMTTVGTPSAVMAWDEPA